MKEDRPSASGGSGGNGSSSSEASAMDVANETTDMAAGTSRGSATWDSGTSPFTKAVASVSANKLGAVRPVTTDSVFPVV